jgi:hypothetical protein
MVQRCKGGFAVFRDGSPHVYAAGQLVGDGDPILRTHGELFEPVEAQVARQEQTPRSVSAVETATAAPGEVRNTSTARKRAGQGDGEK